MTVTVQSKNHIPIRLPEERWAHIIEEHGELRAMHAAVLLTISHAEQILQGNDGELLAVRQIAEGKWMVVVYREQGDDGFVITAFMTRRRRQLDRRKQQWP